MYNRTYNFSAGPATMPVPVLEEIRDELLNYRGAGLDVYAEEPAKNEALLNHPNVSCTPHIGAATKEAQKRIGMEIVSIIDNL